MNGNDGQGTGLFRKKYESAHQAAPVVPGADLAAAKLAGSSELPAFLADD